MRTLNYITFVWLVTLSGCTSLELPSTLRPASHPYAEPISIWSDFEPLPAQTGQVLRSTSPADERHIRRMLKQQLLALKGSRSLGSQPRTGLGLVRRVFGQYDLASTPQSARGKDPLWRRTSPVVGRAASGDILFFSGEHGTPDVGLVRRRLKSGALEYATFHRGKVRFLRLHPQHLETRRRDNTVINSFVRTKQPSDQPRARYLAGQFLIGIRSPF